ncbi:MAG: MFS transporter [Haliea sp.]|nr:MFS transporter [Haliea sp.]
MQTVGDHTSGEPYPAPAVGWYATILLALLYWFSVLDRFIISLLVDPIKQDLGLTDVQFGMLQGLAFLLSFTLFGFMFGALADRVDRRRLIFIGMSIWSLATALCGFAQSFLHLLVGRAGLGAGEAALSPCATSMISDLFPREKLTSAMAVYSIGATVGSGTALMVGGAIVYYASTLGDVVLPVVGQVRTWQVVFLMVGLPGLLLAFSVFTIPEPPRRGVRQALPTGRSWRSAYMDLFRFIRSRPRFFFCHYLGFTLATAGLTGGVGWYPVHMMRSFGWSEGRIGLILGITLMTAGIAGKLITGWVVDAMYRRGYRDAQLRWYAGCLLLGTPFGIIGALSDNPWVFLGGIGLFVTLATSMPACAMTALNLVTPNQLRGTGVTVFTTIAALLGSSIGTVIIPFLSDHVFHSESAIGLGIACLIGVSCPLGAVVLAGGLGAMRRAMAEAEREL